MNPLIDNYLKQFTEVHYGKPWMGPSYARRWGEMETEWVFVRPVAGMHSIAEITSHLTFWRQEALLKIRTGKGSQMDDAPENWLTNDRLEKKGWTAIRSEFNQSLSELLTLLKEKDDAFLEQEYYDTDFKGNYPYRFLVNGMLHHDIYHLGQLGMVIRFLKENFNP